MNLVSRQIPQAQISLSLATDKQVFGHSSWCCVYITLAHNLRLRLAAAARPLELEELGWLAAAKLAAAASTVQPYGIRSFFLLGQLALQSS